MCHFIVIDSIIIMIIVPSLQPRDGIPVEGRKVPNMHKQPTEVGDGSPLREKAITHRGRKFPAMEKLARSRIANCFPKSLRSL